METETSPLKEGTGVSYTETKEGASADSESAFICNICLEVTNKDPVVTQCGHLYCWPCLYRWLNTQHSTCPVCKAGVSKENVIPLFIRGSEQDPRTKNLSEGVPSRPAGRRPEPNNFAFNGNNQNNAGNQYGGVTFSAGLGFFPSLFGLQFQTFSSPSTPSNRPLTTEEQQQANLSRVLILLGSVVILALLFF